MMGLGKWCCHDGVQGGFQGLEYPDRNAKSQREPLMLPTCPLLLPLPIPAPGGSTRLRSKPERECAWMHFLWRSFYPSLFPSETGWTLAGFPPGLSHSRWCYSRLQAEEWGSWCALWLGLSCLPSRCSYYCAVCPTLVSKLDNLLVFRRSPVICFVVLLSLF